MDAGGGIVHGFFKIAGLLLGLLQKAIGDLVAQLAAQLLNLAAHGFNGFLAIGGVNGFTDGCCQRCAGIYALLGQ